MHRISQEYFTTSELAKTSGVTKHTLFHYDEIGLLKPEFTNANGYRYYSLRQCYLLDIIKVLKKTGSSLQQIKEYIQNQNTALLISLLKQKQCELGVEQLRMSRMRSFLDDAIKMIENSMGDIRDDTWIEECEAESFIATPLNQGSGDKEFAGKLSKHRDYCETHNINHDFPIWTILCEDRFKSGDYYPDYIANKLKSPIQCEKIIIKPKGRYALIHHKGSYETISETCSNLKKFIKSNGMLFCGDVYMVEMLHYLVEKDPENYIIRIAVEISDCNS
ncbi:MerR family transcriptional regulator (plasmid) [Paenibacillus urinalis]|uniref:MerR family transcriptional regulator n=1 Tax=Paenibacillus urinalis TaxID=521520 RepID=UPI002368AC3C|nr:MerR family transcriptional regulator [Paenibacillus urinalis]WDH95241.1 MerR family transcriptional regulator [Paenibacillus urinalis]